MRTPSWVLRIFFSRETTIRCRTCANILSEFEQAPGVLCSDHRFAFGLDSRLRRANHEIDFDAARPPLNTDFMAYRPRMLSKALPSSLPTHLTAPVVVSMT
jgi:hypothetical protein